MVMRVPTQSVDSEAAFDRRRGFTMVELLIVIAVIGLLIAAMALVGGRVFYAQKVKATEMLMTNVTMAIEQFTLDNPLASIYDRRDKATFGAFPPYQLAGDVTNLNSVRGALEAGDPALPVQRRHLADRLWRDLGAGQGAISNWVSISGDLGDRPNDDNRALFTYLKVFGGGVLSQVPESAFKPLTDSQEFVNPSGSGTYPGDAGLVDVLGIHDVWGVPLDYFLYVKLEYGPSPTGGVQWRVTDRRPVLRSRGITREQYDQLRGPNFDDLTDTSDGNVLSTGEYSAKWIFSEDLPTPAIGGYTPGSSNWLGFANPANGGWLPGGSTQNNGWAQAAAAANTNADPPDAEDYGYLPGYDPAEP